MKITGADGKSVDQSEHANWSHERTFTLGGQFERMTERQVVDPQSARVILSVEGRLLSGHGDAAVKRALEDTEVILMRDDRPMWRSRAAMITPLDSVLEARVSAIESMLVHLMELESPEGTRGRKLRESMVRLGWKTPQVLDNRRLVQPLYVGGMESYSVEVHCPTGLSCAFDWTCVLRGTQKLMWA